MIQILKLKYPWDNPILIDFIDSVEVTKDMADSIIDNWLICDEGQFEQYPNRMKLFVRKFHLSIIEIFCSTRPIKDERLRLIDKTSSAYKYLVMEK